MQTKVKICGATRVVDFIAAERAGADAVGLNFFPPSPRCVGSLADAVTLMKHVSLPRRLLLAGVFVNPAVGEVLEMAEALNLDIVQLHGEETPLFVANLKRRLKEREVWKALRVSSKRDLALMEEYAPDAFLLDAKVEGQFGGTGQAFDWNILQGVSRTRPLVLSGGLNPRNVAAAVRAVVPDWVDAASGVEAAPGLKESRLINDFIKAVRSAD
jgi:phosphoribosylanthranilate isomerase